METTDVSLQENVLHLPLVYGNCPIITKLEWNQFPQIPITEPDEYMLVHKQNNEYWYSCVYLDEEDIELGETLIHPNIILWARLPKIKCQ